MNADFFYSSDLINFYTSSTNVFMHYFFQFFQLALGIRYLTGSDAAACHYEGRKSLPVTASYTSEPASLLGVATQV